MNRAEAMRMLKAFWPELRWVVLLSAAANVLMLVPTLYMLQVYDRVVVSRNEVTLLAVSVLALLAYWVLALFEWLRTKLLIAAGLRLDGLLGARVFDAACKAALAPAQAGRPPGTALHDLLQVRQYFTGQGIFGFMDLPWVPIYITVMTLLHPALGLAALCFAALQAGVAWWGHRGAVAPAEAVAQAQREEHEFVQAKIRNLDALHAMGMAGPLQAVWQRLHGQCVDQQAFAQSQSHRLVAISKFLRYVQQSGALAVGAWLVIRGELSPGAMVAANVLMSRALAPIDMMVSTWKGFVISREAMRRLALLLNTHPPRHVDNTVRPQASPEVTLEGLTVTVPGRAEPILRGLSGRFSPGTVTVIMGPSGSGKSTLLRCMLGLQPFQGSLAVAGRAPGTMGPTAQGQLVGYLPQELGLFEATVAENIARLGEVDSDLVIKAAKATGLHETILKLPQGYDTAITDSPGLLSGGQRQRLALARAVYGQPSILLLDEPNSNLDEEGEQGLNRTLQEARRQGCTVVVVSHRPSILSMADQLIVLVEGRIVKAGPPAHIIPSLASAPPAVAST